MKRFLTVIFVILVFSMATKAQNCITVTQGSFSVKESYNPIAAADSLELQVSGCTPGTYEITYNGIADPAYNVTVIAPATSFTRKVKVLPPPAINQFQVKKVGEATCVSNFTIFIYPTALPVKLVSFVVEKNNTGKVEITWKVELDTDADRYEIEKSIDGREYKTSLLIWPKNAPGVITYSFADPHPVVLDVVYYRLKIINKNGSAFYSNVKRLILNTTVIGKGLVVMPNPFVHTVILQIDGQVPKPGLAISIYSLSTGQVVLKKVLTGGNSLDVSLLSPGTYLVEAEIDGIIRRQKIIKQ